MSNNGEHSISSVLMIGSWFGDGVNLLRNIIKMRSPRMSIAMM